MYFSRYFLSSVNFHKGEIDDQFKETQSKVFIPPGTRGGQVKAKAQGVVAAEGGQGSWEKELLPGLGRHGFGPEDCLGTRTHTHRFSSAACLSHNPGQGMSVLRACLSFPIYKMGMNTSHYRAVHCS